MTGMTGPFQTYLFHILKHRSPQQVRLDDTRCLGAWMLFFLKETLISSFPLKTNMASWKIIIFNRTCYFPTVLKALEGWKCYFGDGFSLT